MESIESVIKDIPIANESEPVVLSLKLFAVSVQQIDFQEFSGQTFSVNIGNNESLSSDNLAFEELSVSPSTGSISLPNTLLNSIPHNNNTRLTNAVFLSDSLFLRRDNKFMEIGSVIMSATVVGAGTIQNLNPPVTLSFLIRSVCQLDWI